tara:strand:- start:325 stop:600 length:276 start_codon:yes stop_codon:yes gene_type:complete
MTLFSKGKLDRNHKDYVLVEDEWKVFCTPSEGWYVLRGTRNGALCNSAHPEMLEAIADLLNSDLVTCLNAADPDKMTDAERAASTTVYPNR